MTSSSMFTVLRDGAFAAPVTFQARALPVALQNAVGTLNFDIANAKIFSPDVAEILSQVKPHDGERREAMTVPISSADPPTDALVFEAPGDAAQRFYLPRYELATAATDRGSQFRIALARQDPGARLSVVVSPAMPAEVAAAAPQATPIDHQIVAIFSHDLPGMGGARREWLLGDRRDVEGGIELSVLLPGLNDLDAVYTALTEGNSRATLIIRRTITVAIPTGTMTEPPDPLDQGGPIIKRRVPRGGWMDRIGGGRVQVQLAPAVAEIGRFQQRRRIDRDDVVFEPVVIDPVVVDPVVVDPVVADPEPDHVIQLYRATARSLDHVVTPNPFTFSKDLHGYIYGDVTGSGGRGGMVLDQIAFGGRHHSYYYDATRPRVVYFLPDAFKLARVPERPRQPMMSVQFDSPDADPAHASAAVVFGAAATVQVERLRQAAVAIAARTGTALADLDLQPLLADASRLSLSVTLPGSAGASTPLPGARIDLRTALSAGFELPLAKFQALFDRLHGGDPSLFAGEVEVKLDRADRPAEKVPLIVSMSDLAGDPVDVAPLLVASEPRYRATLTNLAESPVSIHSLSATLPQSDASLACDADVAVPFVLAPGESRELVLTPRSAPADPDVTPVVVLEARVQPDVAAIWKAICEDDTSHVNRPITVKTPVQLFTPPTDGTSGVLELVVDLQAAGGGPITTATLNKDMPSVDVHIATPIADLVLHSLDTGEYRYRVQTVRLDAVGEGEWKPKASGVLWIVTTDLT